MSPARQRSPSASVLESCLVGLCLRYVRKLPLPDVRTDQDVGSLSPDERRFLRGLRWRTSVSAFLISCACAVGLFLPAYAGCYPEVRVSVFGWVFRFQWAFWLAMAIWLFVEIAMLVRLNLQSVQQAAVGTGFLDSENRPERDVEVARIALATPAKELARFGLDPYQDANAFGLFVYNLLQLTKGFLAHQVVKLLLLGVGGRAALRAVLDFSGVPIYGAINVFAANRILDEAEIIIMGRKAVEQVAHVLPPFPPAEAFHECVYDALQFVAMSKRDFHPNHTALAEAVLCRYEIPLQEAHRFTADSVSRFESLPSEQRKIVALIVIAGLVLDGRLSAREKRRLDRLNGPKLLGVSAADIAGWAKEFREGKGIGNLLLSCG